MIGIYSIQNTVTGKRYIGSSANVKQRLSQHRYQLRKGVHHSQHLQRAWNVDGADAFAFMVLEECSIEDLLVREQHHISLHRSADGEYGYNVCGVSGTRRGVKVSEASKEKMRQAQQNRPPVSDEVRERMSQSARKPKTEVHRQNISAGKRKHAKPISEAQRKQISEANSRRQSTPESNALRSAALKGKPKSPETIAKIAASRRAGIERRKAQQEDIP